VVVNGEPLTFSLPYLTNRSYTLAFSAVYDAV
jgi:hypothetical protein